MTSMPTPRAEMRCADSDRDRVADVLDAAWAEGRLTRDEHAERIAATRTARTFGELDALVGDLPGTHAAPASLPTPAASPGRMLVDPSHPSADADRIVTVLGDAKRTGHWRLRRHTTGWVGLGDVTLDLREAVFEAEECVIDLTVVLGDLKLRVPEGVAVRDETSSLLGDVKILGLGPAAPGAPTVVLRSRVLLGDIVVHGPQHVGLGERLGLTRRRD